MFHFHKKLPFFQMGIVDQFGNILDGRAGDSVVFQGPNHFRNAAILGPSFNIRLELKDVAEPLDIGPVSRVLHPFFHAQGGAEFPPLFFPDRAHDEISAFTFKNPIGGSIRIVASHPFQNNTFHGITGHSRFQEGCHALLLGGIDVLTFAGLCSIKKGGDNSQGGKKAGGTIADGSSSFGGRPFRITSIFGQYIYDNLDYDSPGNDYYVNNPSVGIAHSFTPTLTSRLQVGYFWRNPVSGKSVDGPTFDAGISQRTPRLTLDLTAQGGYSYDFFSADPLGFTKYYRGIVYVSYRWAERLSSSLTGTLEWDEFPDQAGREDLFSRVEAGLFTYQPWRWFTVSLSGSYGRRDSNLDGFDYDEWRAFLRLTASYW